jgi:hypothetical protein
MTRETPDDRQARQDIHRAEVLMSLAQGLSSDESAAVLKRRAAAGGVSLHGAALAVLGPAPSDEPTDPRSLRSPRHRHGRHLFAVPSGSDIDAAGSTAEIESAR